MFRLASPPGFIFEWFNLVVSNSYSWIIACISTIYMITQIIYIIKLNVLADFPPGFIFDWFNLVN